MRAGSQGCTWACHTPRWRVSVLGSGQLPRPRIVVPARCTPNSDRRSPEWLSRSELLFGDTLERLANTNILLVGLGGVGGFAAEFLARSGIGKMTIVDGDSVDVSNKNRQLIALDSTIGLSKVEVMAKRILDINPDIQLTPMHEFLDTESAQELVSGPAKFDFVVDCIDSVAPKKMLIATARKAGIHVVCSMGAGGRVDPSRVRIVDLSATYNDPFAALLRKNLRRIGVSTDGIMAAWSDEPVDPVSLELTRQQFKRSYYGTASYLPATFGLAIAAYIIQSVTEKGVGAPGYRPPAEQKPVLGRPARSKSCGKSKPSRVKKDPSAPMVTQEPAES